MPPIPPPVDESPLPALPVSLEEAPPHRAQHTTAPAGRWCPYCGADLSGIPERENEDEVMFAVAGRRLKIIIAVLFVLFWLGLSAYDWLNDPAVPILPGWFSALGAVMLFYLLGVSPWGLLRRR